VADRSYRFATFVLDADRALLVRGSALVPLAPKTVALLTILVERAGELVTRAELLALLWPEGFVEEGNLSQHVYLIRSALRSGGIERAIETIPRRGYRFIAAVAAVAPVAAVGAVAAVAAVAANPTAVPSAGSESVAAGAGSPRSRPRARGIHTWPAVLAGIGVLCAILAVAAVRPGPPSAFARLRPESQRLYQLGRFHWNQRDTRLEESVHDFAAVVRHDPHSPLGYAGLADAYLAVYDYPCDDRGCTQIVAKALVNARRAVDVGPDSAVAHTSLAMALHVFANDDGRADAEFARALALDQHYALAHEWFGNSLLERGRLAEARRELEAAVSLDATAPATYAWLARDAYYDRRYDDAIRLAHEALALSPGRFETKLLRALALEQAGRTQAALAAVAALRFSVAGDLHVRVLQAGIYARAGDRRAACRLLDAHTERRAIGDGIGDDVAVAWIAIGAPERALHALRATHDDRRHRAFLALDPRLDLARGDPRFRRWTSLDAGT